MQGSICRGGCGSSTPTVGCSEPNSEKKFFEYSNGIGGESCVYISEVIRYIFSKIVKGLEVPQRDLKVGGLDIELASL